MMKVKNLSKVSRKFHSAIEQFVQLCQQELGDNLVSVILFGSIARNKYNEWSDFDFCVVTKRAQEEKKFKIMQAYHFNCDVVMREEGRFASYLNNLSSLDLEIFNEGIVIFGKDVLKKDKNVFEKIKKKYGLVHQDSLGKGVWEIGIAGY